MVLRRFSAMMNHESRLLYCGSRSAAAEILKSSMSARIAVITVAASVRQDFMTLLVGFWCGCLDGFRRDCRHINSGKRDGFRVRPDSISGESGGKSANNVGSRYNEDNVPNLYVNDDKPALNNNWEDNANPKWGAPSAGSVFANPFPSTAKASA